MGKPLIQVFSEQEKFCCTYGYVTQPKYEKLTNEELAKKLGVSKRTVTDFRSMVKQGGYACRDCKGCRKKLK